MDLIHRPAHEQLAALDRGEVSSRELTAAHLDRIASRPDDNAVVTLDAEGALAAAAAADERRARGRGRGRGRATALLGLPITLKDALETEGLRTTCGAVELSEHVPSRDADAVARLRAAGAVVLGKTNTPPFCQDLQTGNELFGTTPNPHDRRRTAGGSSGGSAAAVAAFLSPLDIGSDLAGSLRLPAHYCGVHSLRPTGGVVPSRGHIPRPPGWLTTSELLSVGPIGRSAADLDLALGVLAGPAPREAAAWRLELPPPRHEQLAGHRIGIWADDPFCPVDAATRALLEELDRVLSDLGVRAGDSAPPVDLASCDRLFRSLMFAGSTASAAPQAFTAELAAARRLPEDDGSPGADYLRDRTMSHRDWLLANEERRRLQERWAAYFEDVDLLIAPAAPTAAVPDQTGVPVPERYLTVDGRRRGYFEQTTWLNLAGLAQLPSATVPLGRTGEGLPLGVQLIGPHLGDRTVVRAAGLLGELWGELRGTQPVFAG
ncbi:amidase [Kitasatospora sp. NBC_01287]|uniref:amidase n=1 Tax=Kitasatospora sp. NBC_01287 TaxID=2903573 RepID=UPI00224F7D95|nr:amidase [Kitasatospora sp. NBC_01287]MCX4750488.1 amidase [Kitasatospora sp. NBC_01287]